MLSSVWNVQSGIWFVQDGSHQAQSNLKFLSILKDPCHELADAHPKDIPPMLPNILNLIRMIWVNSEFYNTKDRLTGILRKVRLSIICSRYLWFQVLRKQQSGYLCVL